MRKLLILLLAGLVWALPVAAAPLVFAPLPMESPSTVASQWRPLLIYLEQQLGVEVQIDYSESNTEVLKKFAAGELDLAYLGPLPYVTLKKSFPAADPVVIFHEKDGQSTYTCALVTADTAKFSLKGLKDRKVALTQPLSTCGWFATEGLLHQQGSSLETNHYRYLGQHDEVALAVVRGEYDLGGVKTAIAQKYAHLGLVVKAVSPFFPGLALVANSNRIAAERIAKIRQALLAAPAEVRAQWGDNIRYGVSAASDKDYDGLRGLPFPAAIPAKGNF